MEFTGSQLLMTLEGQWRECLVEVRSESVGSQFLEPDTAAKLVTAGRYVGVGHHRRIFYLRPCNLGLWRGHRTTERSRNDAGLYIGRPVNTLKHVGTSEG